MASALSETVNEVLPKNGLLFTEQKPMPVLCKPKIMPLKSVTLEKLEKMQKDAQETVKRQEEQEKTAQDINNSENIDEPEPSSY